MQKLWFIANPGSGSTTKQRCEAIEAVFAEHGLTLVGSSEFPTEPLPDANKLDSAGADTVVLFAGDGTINAALCKLAEWDGAFLILPGGTMNLLAKALHDSLDPAEIIRHAHASARLVAMPFVEAGPHRGFVGLIVGPAAQWFRAREQARKRRFGRLVSAMRFAWRRTFGRGIRIAGVPHLKRGYQAVLISPDKQGLAVAAIDARDWRSIVALGWNWISGEWVEARAVDTLSVEHMWIAGARPVLALFDGEPVTLDPQTMISFGMSRKAFLATRQDPA